MSFPVDPNNLSANADLPGLVAAAVAGDRCAWNSIFERFRPLVFSVIQRYRLSENDADDVCQEVWLKLLKHLKDLREPRALPAWIVTSTKNEALRVLSARRRIELVDPQRGSRIDRIESPAFEDDLIRQERRRAVRTALAELRPEHRRLLLMVFANAKVSYLQISCGLGIPAGSIGPTRARCLKKLKNSAPLQALAS